MVGHAVVLEGRIAEIELELAEALGQVEDELTIPVCYLRHLYADCALLREDGEAAAERYARACALALEVGVEAQAIYETEGLAMGLAASGRPSAAVEVFATAQAHREVMELRTDVEWWGELVGRWIGGARTEIGAQEEQAAVARGRARHAEHGLYAVLDLVGPTVG